MNHKLLTFIGLIGMGVVIGATLDSLNKPELTNSDTPNTSNTTSSNSLSNPFSSSNNNSNTDKLVQLEQTIQTLQSQVQTEIRIRQQLEQKVAILEKGLNAPESVRDTDNDKVKQTPTSDASSPHRSGTFNRNANWFNEQALVDAGIDQTKVSHIKNEFEQAEMEKLYIRDQANREGWMGSKRYNESMKEITDRTNALRSQLSDNEYDAYLYAAGRSNRVVVQSVLSNSPASNAGIQPGDVILSYDNQRVYNWTDLTSATSKGDSNSTVSVTIIRDNQQQQVYIPRGPLGIKLITDSVAP